MDIQLGPNSQDEPNLLYKLQHKLKVFNTTDPLPNRGYNLIASSSKYGIVFTASPDGTLSTYYLKDLIDKESEGKHVSVKLLGKVTHIAVSCDQELLALTNGQLLTIYKVTDFTNPNVSPINVSMNIRCDVNPSTFVTALQWNPCIPDSIAMAYHDGTLLVSQVSTGQIKKIASKARCICWSPKGKQLVTGNNDGTLTQYKPDLSPAKTVPAPNLFDGAPVEALAIYWISTFQFAVVYKNAAENSRPAVTIVNTPKAGQPSCISFEDICYSMGTNRPWYYYLLGLPQWNMILCSSSNSMELATLGTDGANWFQWCQSDEGRPELPLTNKRIENYPVGVCIDTCAIHQLPWGENDTLQHMPLLLVLSQSGLLTIFNVINLKNDVPQLCSPPHALTLPESAMVSDIPGEAAPPPAAVQPPQQQQQAQPPPAYEPQPPPLIPPAFSQAPASASSQFAAMGFSAKSLQPTQPVVNQAQPPPEQTKAMTTPQLKNPQVTPLTSQPQAKPPTPLTQETAALREEQEKISKLKADQELKSMLLKEVRDFQMETYKFAVKTRESQIKLQKELNSMTCNFDLHSLDVESLRRECLVEDLRARIVQLKLDLVRTCAVVAETTTHAEMKEVHEWTHADPLTTKRIASINKLQYYIQSQLEQAQKALDHKWTDMAQRNPHFMQGRMIRPILDDIYQPLVKQQEILSRQSAVLRTLKNALNECNSSPIVKSMALLRSTPFRNKDPLSKLTKNILNMSIESKQSNKAETSFSAQKLDALRDMLANNKVVKIKPVNIELTEHMKAIKISYEKSLKEQAKSVEKAKPQAVLTQVEKQEFSKTAPQLIPTSTYAKQNIPGLANVARTLFNDNVQESPKSPQQPVLTPPNAKPSQPTESQKPSLSFAPKAEPTTPVASFPVHIPKKSFGSQQTDQKPILAFGASSDPQKQALPFGSFTAKPILTFGASTDAQKPVLSFGAQKSEDGKPIAFGASKTENQKPILAFGAQKSEDQKPILAFGAQKSEDQKPILAFGAQKSEDQKPILAFGAQKSEDQKPSLATAPRKPEDQKPSLAFAPQKSEDQKPSLAFAAQKSEDQKTIIASGAQKPDSQKPTISLVPQTSEPPKTPTTTATTINTETRSVLKDLLNKNGENTFLGQKICSPSSFSFSASTTATSTPLITAKPIAEISNMFNKFPTIEKKPNDKAKSDETGELEASPNPEDNTEQESETTKTVPASIVPDVLKSTQDVAKPKVEKSDSKDNITDKSKTVLKPSNKENTPTLEDENKTPVTSPTTQTDSSSVTPSTETKETAKPDANSTASSIFAAAASKPSSIFGSTSPSSASKSGFTITPLLGSPTSPGGSIFATTNTSTAFSSSIFGVKTTASEETKPTETVTSTANAEGSKPSPSVDTKAIFGAVPDSKPVEEKPTTPEAGTLTPPAETKPTVFSTPTPAAPSVFGNQSPKPSVFGSSAASIFASANTQASVFGSSPSTTTQSVFGSTTVTTQSIFAKDATPTPVFASPATTQASVFGSTTPTPLFGAATTTTQSIFGATSTPSVFGTAVTQSSVFGSAGQSVFGSPTNKSSVFKAQPATTPSSIFGAAQSQTSIFGQPASNTQSIFGSQPATTASGSLFGNTDNLFASASISTTSAPSQPGGSIFGGGSSTNVFGGKSTFGASNQSAAAIFGGGTSFGQKPAENTNFWGAGANNSGGFGNTGFGQTATTQSSIFGGSTGGSFSSPSPSGGAFSSPAPQGSVFGTPAQQKSPAFGGSAAFGSPAAFGQPPAFGSPPSGFGAGPTFGGFNKSPGGGFGAAASFGGGATFGGSAFGGASPGKVFGGSSPSSGFASASSNATFENLASQNTMTFGNLAQQSAPAQPPSAFNTSPSFTGWRG